jgi:hypothetical protein
MDAAAQTPLALALVALAAAYCLRRALPKRNRPGCGGCAACPAGWSGGRAGRGPRKEAIS